jgi:hypothetical protein
MELEKKGYSTLVVCTCPICGQQYFGTALDIKHTCDQRPISDEAVRE